jgi:hypothetical protein
MHPPRWVLDELVRITPWARIGWLGKERGPKDELNKGEFVLLDLIKARLIDKTFKEPWADRGPVYGPWFDPLARMPVMIKAYQPEEVFGGAIIADVKRLVTPLKPRLDKTWLAEERKYRDGISDLAGQMGSELYWRAHRNIEGGIATHLPNKCLTKKEKEVLTGEWKQHLPEAKPPPVSAVALA